MKKLNEHRYAGVGFARVLAEQGYRIFKTADIKKRAKELGILPSYVNVALYYLKKNNWIEPIRRGVYSLNPIFLAGNPIHEFEIATQLADDCIISHFSAFHYYGLTDQIPQVIYVTVKTGTVIPRAGEGKRIMVWGVPYIFSQIKLSQFFGHNTIWVGETKIKITDKERTLVDGLIKPQYCGGITEVISAYKQGLPELNIKTLIDYSLKLDASVCKRLGWILEKHGISEKFLLKLEQVPFKGFIKLDVSAPSKGSYNKRWQIQENL